MNDLLDDNNFFIFDDVNVRISPVSKTPFRKKPRDSMHIVQIYLWIIDSGCSKHMTGNHTLLMNFVEKFLGTVCFGNNDFAVIAGYGDVVIGSMTIKKVYYVRLALFITHQQLGCSTVGVFVLGFGSAPLVCVGFMAATTSGQNRDCESSMIGLELVLETTDNVVFIKEKLKAARDCQKSYVDYGRKPLELELGDRVLLKVTPGKVVVCFGKKRKCVIGIGSCVLSIQVVRIPLEGDEILWVHGERTQGVVKTLMNTKESSLTGLELVLEMTDKVVLIKEKLKVARDYRKSYVDYGRKPLVLDVGDCVLLKVTPLMGVVRFGKKRKLPPRYVGPFEVLESIGLVAYSLRLPKKLNSVHDTFHVSNLKKFLADANLHVPLEEIKDIRISSSTGRYFTQEDVANEALAYRYSQKFALLKEYKKVLDEIWTEKVELDGMIVKEEEEAIKKVKAKALKEKDNPRAFIFPIRLKG
nr:putative reverse transcriptase domain-containing protein [Tanacetum cinerariifolium]